VTTLKSAEATPVLRKVKIINKYQNIMKKLIHTEPNSEQNAFPRIPLFPPFSTCRSAAGVTFFGQPQLSVPGRL
jgi:hypothetical protein